eukprot:Cvel_15781.t2-p1 / transcript=Cvel_15781.t2 / gene=Cvel_15781 / organism=Chromera_velia_CCMP2878 / gene_product=hypothetical protein / transcript_product=hypothetical protein / location=Cvel_scaffold1184:4456-7441(+) / protein_length=995 / sequence_SO=supercontig / SO=protein_coding / is_pseudo=false
MYASEAAQSVYANASRDRERERGRERTSTSSSRNMRERTGPKEREQASPYRSPQAAPPSKGLYSKLLSASSNNVHKPKKKPTNSHLNSSQHSASTPSLSCVECVKEKIKHKVLNLLDQEYQKSNDDHIREFSSNVAQLFEEKPVLASRANTSDSKSRTTHSGRDPEKLSRHPTRERDTRPGPTKHAGGGPRSRPNTSPDHSGGMPRPPLPPSSQALPRPETRAGGPSRRERADALRSQWAAQTGTRAVPLPVRQPAPSPPSSHFPDHHYVQSSSVASPGFAPSPAAPGSAWGVTSASTPPSGGPSFSGPIRPGWEFVEQYVEAPTATEPRGGPGRGSAGASLPPVVPPPAPLKRAPPPCSPFSSPAPVASREREPVSQTGGSNRRVLHWREGRADSAHAAGCPDCAREKEEADKEKQKENPANQSHPWQLKSASCRECDKEEVQFKRREPPAAAQQTPCLCLHHPTLPNQGGLPPSYTDIKRPEPIPTPPPPCPCCQPPRFVHRIDREPAVPFCDPCDEASCPVPEGHLCSKKPYLPLPEGIHPVKGTFKGPVSIQEMALKLGLHEEQRTERAMIAAPDRAKQAGDLPAVLLRHLQALKQEEGGGCPELNHPIRNQEFLTVGTANAQLTPFVSFGHPYDVPRPKSPAEKHYEETAMWRLNNPSVTQRDSILEQPQLQNPPPPQGTQEGGEQSTANQSSCPPQPAQRTFTSQPGTATSYVRTTAAPSSSSKNPPAPVAHYTVAVFDSKERQAFARKSMTSIKKTSGSLPSSVNDTPGGFERETGAALSLMPPPPACCPADAVEPQRPKGLFPDTYISPFSHTDAGAVLGTFSTRPENRHIATWDGVDRFVLDKRGRMGPLLVPQGSHGSSLPPNVSMSTTQGGALGRPTPRSLIGPDASRRPEPAQDGIAIFDSRAMRMLIKEQEDRTREDRTKPEVSFFQKALRLPSNAQTAKVQTVQPVGGLVKGKSSLGIGMEAGGDRGGEALQEENRKDEKE